VTHSQRAPTDAAAKYHRQWILSIAALDAVTGVFYVFGGVATTPTLLLMQQIMPMTLWGALLVLVGALLVVRRHEVAGFAGGVVWLMFTTAAVITLVRHTALAAGSSPMTGGLGLLHLLITYGAVTGLSSGARR
jgi:hypothetical protein